MNPSSNLEPKCSFDVGREKRALCQEVFRGVALLALGALLAIGLSTQLAGCSSAAADGFPCSPDGTCDDGLVCVDGICMLYPCLGVSCEPGEVCRYGRCYPENCDDRECPSDMICLDGDCVSDTCANVSCDVDHACAAGQCYPTSCSGLDCGAGVCVDGQCVPRSCVDVDCPPGEACALGACYPLDCAQACAAGEVCVDGACMEAACVGVTCPSDMVCDAGVCATGDTSPQPECQDNQGCAADQVCDNGVCVNVGTGGCTTDMECNDGYYCSGGQCLEQRANGQTCSSPNQCQSGFCEDGICCDTQCQDATCTDWSSCGDFADECDQNGVQTRSCTVLECSTGQCATSTTQEERPCTRDTDGDTCGPTGSWGECTPSTTDSCQGTQTRSAHLCLQGSCQEDIETRSCNIPSGTPCGSPGSWTDCSTNAPGSCTGTRSRELYTCNGNGSCVTSTQDDTCNMPDGTVCDVEQFCCDIAQYCTREIWCAGGSCSNTRAQVWHDCPPDQICVNDECRPYYECSRCSNNYGCTRATWQSYFSGCDYEDRVPGTVVYTTDCSCECQHGAGGGNDNRCASHCGWHCCSRCSSNYGCVLATWHGEYSDCEYEDMVDGTLEYTTDCSCPCRHGAGGGNDDTCTSDCGQGCN